MEFRCRLGTRGRRDHRRRLRRRERGAAAPRVRGARACTSSRSQPRGRHRRLGRPAAAAPARSRRASSSSSTRSWRRCSRPACRSCSRSTSCGTRRHEPGLQAACSTTSTSRCEAGTALSDAFEAHGDAVPARLHGVADGRREERQPRGGAPPLRRLRQGASAPCSRKTISALIYPAVLVDARRRRRRDHRAAVVPAFSDFYAQLRRASCRWRRGSSSRVSTFVSGIPAASWSSASVGAASRRRGVGDAAGAARRGSTARCSAVPLLGDDGAEVRDLADGADAGDAARRRHSARQRARRRGAVDRQPVHGARARRRGAAGARRAERWPRRCDARRRVPGRRGQDGRSRRVDRRAAGDAEQPRRLLRRGDRDRARAGSSRWSSRSCSSSWAS